MEKAQTEKRFQRDIVFTRLPMNKPFKYKDEFQIFPADLKGMPTTKVAHKHYPLIMEYWYTENELKNIPVDDIFEGLEDLHQLTSITYRKRDLIMSLLSVLTTHLFFNYTFSDARWGMPILDENAGSEMNNWESKWCLELFHWPGLPEQLKISQFTPGIGGSESYVPWDTYYQKPNFDWDIEGEVLFSDITTRFLDSYFKTDKDTRQVLNSAIASSNAAMEFMSSRKKIALLSAFTSIETMVNFDTKDFKPLKCKECGQDIFKVAARYRDFLLKYIGDSEANKRKFNSYYSLRSKIVHTGQEFQTEKLFSDVDKEVKKQEYLQIAQVVILSKLSILLWTIKTQN